MYLSPCQPLQVELVQTAQAVHALGEEVERLQEEANAIQEEEEEVHREVKEGILIDITDGTQGKRLIGTEIVLYILQPS